ncbi:MAG: hypothetical protein SOX71_01660 [Candidatus Faecousia sp.]|nr:hypothetical protein [Candidatus Faecousia sp.]
MKFNTIVKIVTALAAAVGAVYIVATYGDKIVEWAKGIMGCCSKPVVNAPAPQAPEEDFVTEETTEAPAEAQEAPAAETATEKAEETTEAVLSDDAIPVADEEDFEG